MKKFLRDDLMDMLRFAETSTKFSNDSTPKGMLYHSTFAGVK